MKHERAGAEVPLRLLTPAIPSPPPQVRLIIQQLAPAGLWQEGRAAAHPDIPPVRLHSSSGFRQLVHATQTATGGSLPPRSRLSADALVPRQAAPPQARQPCSPLAALNRLMGGLFGAAH